MNRPLVALLGLVVLFGGAALLYTPQVSGQATVANGLGGTTGTAGTGNDSPSPHTWIVQAGPHTCVGGANVGLACAGDADCPSSTCTGTGTLTFRDVRPGLAFPTTSNIVEGDTVEWD